MGTAFLYGNGGSGGTGATLTVNAPAGCTVTISKDGKTKTKTAGTDGVAVFKGLATGQWTVTITDGEQTAQKTVTITADYSAEITFFSATIHVTYPAGSTCTATDGTTTLSAPDTSGTWDCVVPNAGTWTVKFVDGETEFYSKDIEITENGQSANVTPVFLYYYGNECTGITGGWETISSKTPFEKRSDCLYIQGIVGVAVAGCTPNNKVNPNLKKIYVDAGTSGTTDLILQFNDGDFPYVSNPTVQNIYSSFNVRIVAKIDTDSINISGKLGIMSGSNNGCNIYRVWIE